MTFTELPPIVLLKKKQRCAVPFINTDFTVSHFYPSQIFVSKARCINGSTLAGPSLDNKYLTRAKEIEVTNPPAYSAAKLMTSLKVVTEKTSMGIQLGPIF